MSDFVFAQWLKTHEAKTLPLDKELGLAQWQLATTGKKEWEEKVAHLKTQMRQIYADKKDYGLLNELYRSENERQKLSALENRQLAVLWRNFSSYQFDPKTIEEISNIETKADGIYSNFRGKMNGKNIDNNAIRKILREENDSEIRKQAWLASKQIGPEVESLVLNLVKLRNLGAKTCGFSNYYQMSLELGELDEEKLFSLLDHLADQTQKPFLKAKGQLDEELAERFHCSPKNLRPWHYADPFFQEAPPRKTFDIDPLYQDKDIVQLTRNTFEGMGLEIEGILNKSDLFGREGKDQHAFCTMIDHHQDVRVLCNVEKNDYWMSTMLHEFGHGVYDWYLDPNLPPTLHRPAHILSTEAIAMLFGRLNRNAMWLEKILGLSESQVSSFLKDCQDQQALGMLIFVRWVLVMCHFERALYSNPDQNLNQLWWQFVERFQDLRLESKRDKPDWASKLHIALAPVYYQNYLMGELIASQLENYIGKNFSGPKGFIGKKAVGNYLREEYFKPGARLRWDHHLEQATKEKLNPDYFLKQFVK